MVPTRKLFGGKTRMIIFLRVTGIAWRISIWLTVMTRVARVYLCKIPKKRVGVPSGGSVRAEATALSRMEGSVSSARIL